MNIQDFLATLHTNPDSVQFSDTIATIDANFQFTPTRFRNGEQNNEAGQNSGSCKILSFAQLQGLNSAHTLACFGDYYRVDVLQHPSADDHQNIRNFMKYGWQGIQFDGPALQPK